LPDITMPQLGETVTEGRYPLDEEVATRSPATSLVRVSTDKVDSEVPSPAAGLPRGDPRSRGATVDVGTKLAVVTTTCPRQASGEFAGRAWPQPRHRLCRPSELRGGDRSARAAGRAFKRTAGVGPAPSEKARAGPIRARMGRGCAVSRRTSARRRVRHRPGYGTGDRKGGRITRADVLAFIDYRAAGGEAPVGEATPRLGPRRWRNARIAAVTRPPFVRARRGQRDEVVRSRTSGE